MNEVLIISAEPRLVQAIKGVVGETENRITAVDRWATGQALLFKDHFDVVCLDYECLKLEALDAFITIDNIFQKERTVGLLLVRQESNRSKQLETQLKSLGTTIDMSAGKEYFSSELNRIFGSIEAMRDARDERSVEIDNIVSLEKDLANVDAGRLSKVPLARILYTLRVRKETGILEIKSGARHAKIGFLKGEICEGPGLAPRTDVLSMFEWVGGGYEFKAAGVKGRSVDTFSVILAGISRVPHQSLVDALRNSTAHKAVPTNLWEDRRDKLREFIALSALVRSCDGTRSLDEVLTGLGSLSHEGFKAAYYAVQTDLLHLHDGSGISGAIITYSREIRQQRAKVDQAKVQQTKAFRAATSGRSELEKELNQQLVFVNNASAHDIFGVWEGCGRKVIQERFYVMVKETHPDVYGGNVSGAVKTLAQDIFIKFKDTYQVLLRTEREQTVPPPESYGATPTLEEPSEVSFKGGDRPTTGTSRRSLRRTPTPQRTVSNTPVRTSLTTSPSPTEQAQEPRKKIDVASKISRLSGFQKRKARTERRRAKTDPGQKAPQFDEAEIEHFSEVSESTENSEATSDPAVEAEARKSRLDALMKRASEKTGAAGPNPARDAFHEGYRLYRNEEYQKAYVSASKAHKLAPEDGLYMTFYGYLMYKNDPSTINDAEDTIRKAINTGNRQALPDACLFLGHLLKARGQSEKAIRQYERALRLNPGCTEAEREIRLSKMREKRGTSDPGTFIKKLFKK